jgi:two-component system response regulator TctD
MRLLLAEDNRPLSDGLARLLRKGNYVVDCVYSGQDADTALRAQNFDLVILDLGLPHMDGLTVLKRLRSRDQGTPVLVLTASDAVPSRVKGLNSGADDYLVKPFDIDELEARIRAQLRRSLANSNPQVACGQLVLETNARQFTVAGRRVALTPREHAVLEALLLRAGRPVAKKALAESAFGFDDLADTSAIEIYVHRVRRKLDGADVGIVTLRGLGYMLCRNDAA